MVINTLSIPKNCLFISANARGLPQFGYLMLCPPGDDVIKKRKFDDNEKQIAKRSPQ